MDPVPPIPAIDPAGFLAEPAAAEGSARTGGTFADLFPEANAALAQALATGATRPIPRVAAVPRPALDPAAPEPGAGDPARRRAPAGGPPGPIPLPAPPRAGGRRVTVTVDVDGERVPLTRIETSEGAPRDAPPSLDPEGRPIRFGLPAGGVEVVDPATRAQTPPQGSGLRGPERASPVDAGLPDAPATRAAPAAPARDVGPRAIRLETAPPSPAAGPPGGVPAPPSPQAAPRDARRATEPLAGRGASPVGADPPREPQDRRPAPGARTGRPVPGGIEIRVDSPARPEPGRPRATGASPAREARADAADRPPRDTQPSGSADERPAAPTRLLQRAQSLYRAVAESARLADRIVTGPDIVVPPKRTGLPSGPSVGTGNTGEATQRTILRSDATGPDPTAPRPRAERATAAAERTQAPPPGTEGARASAPARPPGEAPPPASAADRPSPERAHGERPPADRPAGDRIVPERNAVERNSAFERNAPERSATSGSGAPGSSAQPGATARPAPGTTPHGTASAAGETAAAPAPPAPPPPAPAGEGAASLPAPDRSPLPRTLAERGLGREVVEQIRARFDPGRGEVRVVLEPRDLGTVDLQVRLRHDRVEVRLDASEAHTRVLLERHLPELRDALTRAGVHADDIRIHDGDPRASTAPPAGSGPGGESGSRSRRGPSREAPARSPRAPFDPDRPDGPTELEPRAAEANPASAREPGGIDLVV